jgi:hypothetical protein
MNSCRRNSAGALAKSGRRRCAGLIRRIATLSDPTMSRPSRARVCSTECRLQAPIRAAQHTCRDLQLGAADRDAPFVWVSPRSRHWLLGIAALCALLAAPRALARPPALRVQWQAPQGCPDQAEMLKRVAAVVGDDALPADLRVIGDVTQTANGYRAQLSIQAGGNTGLRTLDHSQCDILADSAALVIALSAHRAEDPARAKLSLSVATHASVVDGVLPRAALGGGVGVALEGWASLRWELNGSYYAGQTATYEGLSIGADFRLLRVAARGCRVWSLGRCDLAPCIGAELYRIDGAGFGGQVQKNGGAFVWGPALSMFLRLRVWRSLNAQLSAGANLAVSRQRFTYGDLGLLHRPDALAYQVSLAPEVLF